MPELLRALMELNYSQRLIPFVRGSIALYKYVMDCMLVVIPLTSGDKPLAKHCDWGEF